MTADPFNTLCDSVALIYHESRNVRHLVHKKLVEGERWRFIVSLPTNRADAWREIISLRGKALESSLVDSALLVFESRFHVSLHDLSEMFGNENWRHAKHFGGNAWAEIAKLAIQLVEALRNKDEIAAKQIATQLNSAKHNTGFVHEKIARLEKERLG